MNAQLRPETIVVDHGRPARDHDAPLNVPVTFTSTFIGTRPVDGADYAYARFGNPTWDPFEDTVATLEGAALPGLAYASGLAAIAAALDLVAPQGTVIAPKHAYMGGLAGARDQAARGRFTLLTVDIDDTAQVLDAVAQAAASQPGRQAGEVLLWIESPTNPMMEVADLPALIAGAKERGALVVVDNTFSTPLVTRPLQLGADVVVHSATKYLAGHSDVVIGIAVTSDLELRGKLLHHRSLQGAIAGPMEVFLALRGLRTLALRMERAQDNAGELARRLQSLPGVQVRYPGLPEDPGHERAKAQMDGFGAILCAVFPSGKIAHQVTENVRLWTPATSLGGVESLIERRRRHPSEPETVPEGLVRLSVGIEHVEDLWADLSAAIDHAMS